MPEDKNRFPLANMSTRRQVIAGVAVAFGRLAAGSEVCAEAPQQDTKRSFPTAAHRSRTSLHQEVDFKASPQRIYQVLLDSRQFAAFTGLRAEIDPRAGGAFTMFGGLIVGRNIELIPDQRIVQAWRPANWDPGVYSLVKLELKPQSEETLVVLDHTGFPEGDFDGLNTGWRPRYWEPLKKFLA